MRPLRFRSCSPASSAVRATACWRTTTSGRPPADRWELPKELDEISGLAADGGGRLFAHGDERAIVYQLDPASHRVLKRVAFGHPAVHGDFEGIALADDRVVLTTSDGVLYLAREGSDGEAVQYTVRDTGVGRRCEVEGLAYEPSERILLLACKLPRVESLKGRVAVYAWSLERQALVPDPRFLVPLSQITGRLGGSTFHPSDLAAIPRPDATCWWPLESGRSRTHRHRQGRRGERTAPLAAPAARGARLRRRRRAARERRGEREARHPHRVPAAAVAPTQPFLATAAGSTWAKISATRRRARPR